MKRYIYQLTPYGIILFFFLFVTYPLFHGGFFPTMDDVQVVRVDEMSRELLAGQFPVRLIHHLGFGAGSLLFNFYGTLAYYLGALLHIFGISLVRSTKFVFVVGYIIGSLGMYFLVKKYTDKVTACIATLLFLTATYLNYDVYVRGSLGEFFGFVILPLLFWSFLRLRDRIDFLSITLAGVLMAASIISHPLTAVMGCGFLIVLIIVLSFQKERMIASIIAFLLGLGLAAFSWLPVAFEQQYLNLTHNSYETSQYLSNFLTPLQVAGILRIPWGFKPPLLGIGLFIGALLGIYFTFLEKNKEKRIGLFAIVSFLLSLFMISVLSKPLWAASAYVKLVQFPWRYLVITTISAIMLCSIFLTNIKKIWLRIFLGALLLFPAVTLQYSYLRPSSYNYIAVYTADDVCNTSTWAQEYLPKWVQTCIPKNSKIPLISSSNGLDIQNINEMKGGREIVFQTNGQKGTVVIKKYYFPGWMTYVDNKKVVSYPSTKFGLLTTAIPSGKHHVRVSFENTEDRMLGNIISAASLFVIISWIIYALYKRKFHFSLA